jgi:hypothetical protein
MAPLIRRTTTSIHRLWPAAVTKEAQRQARKAQQQHRARPYRSDSAPSMGEPKKVGNTKRKETPAKPERLVGLRLVNCPTRCGSTGMISPIDIMSISTVIMMKGIAAGRPSKKEAGPQRRGADQSAR